MLNNNILLTGGKEGNILQWKIEGDNLILISHKEKAHSRTINALLNLGDGYIAFCSCDEMVKIW